MVPPIVRPRDSAIYEQPGSRQKSSQNPRKVPPGNEFAFAGLIPDQHLAQRRGLSIPQDDFSGGRLRQNDKFDQPGRAHVREVLDSEYESVQSLLGIAQELDVGFGQAWDIDFVALYGIALKPDLIPESMLSKRRAEESAIVNRKVFLSLPSNTDRRCLPPIWFMGPTDITTNGSSP